MESPNPLFPLITLQNRTHRDNTWYTHSKWFVFGYVTIVSSTITGLYYYWFAIADRYAIFLYNHGGSQPFDPGTKSRYWMTGLVASGIVMVLYMTINWYLGRLAGIFNRSFITPPWWKVWLWSMPIITINTFVITTCFNQPTLPFDDALKCALIIAIGLAMALTPGKIAAAQPIRHFWLVLIGAGLVPILLLFRVIELPSQGFYLSRDTYLLAFGSMIIGAIWSGSILKLCLTRMAISFNAIEVILAGAMLSYLLLPVAHYLFLVPPEFRYITTASNFFASSWTVQIASWLITICLGIFLTRFLGEAS